MSGLPQFATRLDAARFLVQENRLPEIWFDDLSAQDRATIVVDLRAMLWRVRRRVLIAHSIGIALTLCFLVAGIAVMWIGPAEVRGEFNRWIGLRSSDNEIMIHWGVLIAILAAGGFGADYILRGRLKVARMWDAESAELHEAIRRGDSRHPA